jgi:hypothetical protein
MFQAAWTVWADQISNDAITQKDAGSRKIDRSPVRPRARIYFRLRCWRSCVELLRGYVNTEFVDEHYDSFLREIGPRVRSGEIHYREDIVDGLEKAPEAFIGMLAGRNFGRSPFVMLAGFRRRRCRREGRVTSWRKNPALAVSHSHRTKSA